MTRVSPFDRFIHSGRIVSAFALGGAVLSGLALGWLPALATVDVHAIGAVVGGFAGAIANARHLV